MAEFEHAQGTSDGSALPWILEHYLRYPGSYEIPLRTMYALNSNPTHQQLHSPTAPEYVYPESAFAPRSSTTSSNSSTSQDASSDRAAQFKAQLMNQIARLPSQPCSLPPTFVTSFLRRCFPVNVEEVDFPQALTALDYLKDLEVRRKKDVVSALKRLGVDRNNLHEMEELAEKYPGVMSWIEMIEAKVKRCEALYTQVYIGLRRWTLLNEMLLEPYNKANCLAMLNTLFPPITEATVPPTTQLTPQILKSQRDGFFRYIAAIDTSGKQILDKVVMQGAREGDETGWPLVWDALNKYLCVANDIIDDCFAVNDPDSLEKEDAERRDRKNRKADSGISFGSSSISNENLADKPLPPSPTRNKSGSTLERLARELRKLGDAGKSKNKSLKKMRSTSALSNRSENLPTPTHPGDDSYFDVDEMKRKRLIWEANNRKRNLARKSDGDAH